MKQTVTFSAHHYVDRGDDLPRERSKRQDIVFTLEGDSITVALPPPAACVLYLDVTPRAFLDLMQRAASNPEKT